MKKLLFLMIILIYSANEANVCNQSRTRNCCNIARGQNRNRYNQCRNFRTNFCTHLAPNSLGRNKCCCNSNGGRWII